MFADLRAAAECEIHNMNPIGVENSEGSRATLGMRAWKRGVVTELEDMTGLTKG